MERTSRATVSYIAVIEAAADGSYSAYVPDLPGCVSCGDSLEEARTLIEEAVALQLESLRRHRDPVPPPLANTHTVHAG